MTTTGLISPRDLHFRAGALTIEPRSRQARLGERLLDLTTREFDLLAYLLARAGRVFSRNELLREVWQSNEEWQQPATVTEHIRRLRSKIEIEPRRPRILRTVRGVGYRLDIPEEPRNVCRSGAGFSLGSVSGIDGFIVRADEAAAVLFGPVLSELTDAVYITDPRLQVRSWNQAAERLYGWAHHEVVGRHILDVLPWVAGSGELAALWADLHRTGRWEGNRLQITRDGAVISVLACTTLVRNEAGEPVVVVFIARPTPNGIDRCENSPSSDPAGA